MTRLTPRPTRRTLLHAIAGGLALPALGSARAVFPGRSGRSGRGTRAPLRVAFVYLPNGIHMPAWRPAEEGPLAEAELPPLLAPLAPYRDRLSVLGGLTADTARPNGDGPGDHARAAAAYLTAAQPVKADGTVIRVGRSADQVIARAVGGDSRFASLQLGCEGGRQSGQCDSGYPCVYSSNLAWSTPHTPLVHETNPRLVFDRLFGVGLAHLSPEERAARLRQKKSVLDFVAGETRALGACMDARDLRKLEELLEGVRELERRIDNATDPAAVALQRPTGRPDDFGEHVALSYELLALALATDATRVATFLVANEGSNRSYPDLDVRDGHHTLSHHGNEPEKLVQIERINRFHLERFRDFLDRLAESGALDDTLVVLGSGIADGNRHEHHDLPILVAGGGGRLPLGAYRRFERDTPLANLYRLLFERFGLEIDAFGDSTGVLAL